MNSSSSSSSSSREEKRSGGSGKEVKAVVAVKASKEIPKTALVWALTHVVLPGDSITLLVLLTPPSPSSTGRWLWGFPRFPGDCSNGHRRSNDGAASLDHKFDIKDSCSHMILQLHDVYDPNKINVKIKIVPGSSCGAVAVEAKKAQANWVVLDKHLRHEEKLCMEELNCNIVVMKRSQPKVLRLNLVGASNPKRSQAAMPPHSQLDNDSSDKHLKGKNTSSDSIRGPVVTPTSSPELGTSFTTPEAGTSSLSSDTGTSQCLVSDGNNGDLKKGESLLRPEESRECDEYGSESESEQLSTASASLRFDPWIGELLSPRFQSCRQMEVGCSQRGNRIAQASTTRAFLERFSKLDRQNGTGVPIYKVGTDLAGDVREAISLSRSAPPGPPPLCSICQHKAPVFGKPPKWFSYAELELATGGFSQANFLAEGGFGSVHRGVLPDGQAIAVKQHKLASSQGDLEFCSEVEVLSCAQHRNVVMLIGFCIEGNRRLLVYEYICNGSLDSHLYGNNRQPLEWSARQKIAIGAARGLRYLHEECRVGCIVHRDMRPNNILITHDFEPLVGDFGLARWQPDGDIGVETRVIGTFGYLAPEYAQSGQITEKADVYSFGVVLVELVTGRKAVDLNRPKGQQCLTEWARPLLEEYAIDELIDPRLGNCYSEQEVYCMLQAASLCIRRDPHSRPRMSQVLRILEGDMLMDGNYMSTPSYDMGHRSGHLWEDQQQQQKQHRDGCLMPIETLEAFSGKISLEVPRPALWEMDNKARKVSRENDF